MVTARRRRLRDGDGRRAAKAGGTGAATVDSVAVDPIACDGIGMCAHLAPGVIAIDSWGYPVLPRQQLTGRELRAARAAIRGCPRAALFLESDPIG